MGQGVRRVRPASELATSQHAVVWSSRWRSQACKPSHVAIRRSQLSPGRVLRREFEYKRHGTAVLFAALSVHEGTLAGWVTDSSRSDNFVTFLGDLRPRRQRTRPALHRRHPAAHKTAKVTEFLKLTLGCTSITHPIYRQLAQPGRAVLLNPRTSAAATWRVSIRSTTWPTGSSPSSRTTTAERPRSVGPMTASPYESRKSQ